MLLSNLQFETQPTARIYVKKQLGIKANFGHELQTDD